MIKFNRYNVSNGTQKARVFYSLDNRIDGRKCVTLYSKDYGRQLGEIFPDNYKNDTDIQTDYFDKGRVNLFEGSPHYSAARTRAEAILLTDTPFGKEEQMNYHQIEYRRQRKIVRSLKSLVRMLANQNNRNELRTSIFYSWKERAAARATAKFHATHKAA